MNVRWIAAPVLLLSLVSFGVACGDDTGGDTSGGDSDGSDGNDTTTSGSEQTCLSSHTCVNDVCECDTEGRAGQSCTDNTACEDECEVCSS